VEEGADSVGGIDPSSIHERLRFEGAVVEETKKLFEKASWVVDEKPDAGTTEPDLVVHSPKGATYVVEFKAGAGSAHFGSLAQLDTSLKEYERRNQEHARGVFVTTMDIQEGIADAADKLDVEIVSASGDAREIAQAVLQRLRQASQGSKES
jgi:Restriction endonuclease